MAEPGADLGRDIADFAADPNAEALEAALLVGRALADQFDPGRCRDDLNALADACPAASDPWRYLAELGFAGSQDGFDAIHDSRMDHVLEHRKGIPISLGVLLVHVSRRGGQPAEGINFPGHFLVRVGQQLVDPLQMVATDEQACIDKFGQRHAAVVGGGVDAALFPIASPQAILLRMLNNVKYQFAGEGRWDRALDMLDWQLCVEPDNAQLYLERGELWSQIGAVSAAREAYARVAELTNDPRLRAAVQARLDRLGDDELLH